MKIQSPQKEFEIFESTATVEQKRIRDRIEIEAKRLGIPPSEHQYNLEKAGKLKGFID